MPLKKAKDKVHALQHHGRASKKPSRFRSLQTAADRLKHGGSEPELTESLVDVVNTSTDLSHDLQANPMRSAQEFGSTFLKTAGDFLGSAQSFIQNNSGASPQLKVILTQAIKVINDVIKKLSDVFSKLFENLFKGPSANADHGKSHDDSHKPGIKRK